MLIKRIKRLIGAIDLCQKVRKVRRRRPNARQKSRKQNKRSRRQQNLRGKDSAKDLCVWARNYPGSRERITKITSRFSLFLHPDDQRFTTQPFQHDSPSSQPCTYLQSLDHLWLSGSKIEFTFATKCLNVTSRFGTLRLRHSLKPADSKVN